MDAGGGYTGGGGERTCLANENGQGGTSTENFCGGGGYFSQGRIGSTHFSNTQSYIGGQGGVSCTALGSGYCLDSGGDGGIAGKGGKVSVSSEAKVYAYNGNRYTDSETVEGHKYTEDTAIINQCPIFAQNGVLRAVYKYNTHWGDKPTNSYQYLLTVMLAKDLKITGEISQASATVQKDNILIRDVIEDNSSTVDKTNANYRKIITDYKNPSDLSIKYGVGSGAGYIEISNGTYEIKTELN